MNKDGLHNTAQEQDNKPQASGTGAAAVRQPAPPAPRPPGMPPMTTPPPKTPPAPPAEKGKDE